MRLGENSVVFIIGSQTGSFRVRFESLSIKEAELFTLLARSSPTFYMVLRVLPGRSDA